MKKLLLSLLTISISASVFSQACSDLFISEYVEGTFNNKAIELYNPTASPIVLDGAYSMGRERNGDGQPMLLPLTGTISPYDVRVFAVDKRDTSGTGTEAPLWPELLALVDTFLNPVYVQSNSPMYFDGNDAFFLVKTVDNVNQILDILGKSGENPGVAWSVPGDPNTRWWTVDQTLIRKPSVLRGVSDNPDVFDPSLEWDSLPVNTFTELGEHLCNCNTNPIAVNELDERTFNIFPNPIITGAFAIKSSALMKSITLFSADGRLIEQQNLNSVTYSNIVLPKAEAGVYFIEVIYTDGRKAVQKIMAR
jgi:hypothetical protein